MPTPPYQVIGDRVDIVVSLLGGRTDKNSDISRWILDGYREIAHAVPFEELESTMETSVLPQTPTVDYPVDARAIKDLTLTFPATGNAASRMPIYKRNKDIINRYIDTTFGVPSIWCPYNNQMHFRQVPDQPYPLTVDYWRKVIPNAVNVDNTLIELPDEWIEVVDYGAEIRGLIDLREYDKAGALRTFLWGDPSPAKKTPGLIKTKLTRIMAEYQNANYGMRPRLTRYNGGVR